MSLLLFLLRCTVCSLVFCVQPWRAQAALSAEQVAIAVEALQRLKGLDLAANPAMKAAVMRVVDATKGTAVFVDLVRDFDLRDQDEELVRYALAHPSDSAGVEAMRVVLAQGATNRITATLQGPDAPKAAEALGHTGERRIVPLLEPLLADPRMELRTRQQIVRALAQIQEGAQALLNAAKHDRLPADLRWLTSMELQSVRWPELKTEAARVLPPPQPRGGDPLPPIALLINRTGDPKVGQDLFFRAEVGCAQCHQIGDRGIDFGPKLTEIGTKLGRDALYAAILDPSAGIAFGFEAWQLQLTDGEEAYGLIASETQDEVALKTPTGVITRLKKSRIAHRKKLALSAMPAGLEQSMSTDELVHLVTYLSSLKKANP